MPFSVSRLPMSRRTLVIGAAVVAALAVAVTLVVVLTGGSRTGAGGPAAVPLVKPVAEKDTVPKLRTYAKKDIPKSCGVRAATVKKYAPGDDDENGRTHCHWYSLNSGHEHCPGFCPASSGDTERVLDVTITLATAPSTDHSSKSGTALRTLNPYGVSAVESGRTARPVVGLGDEAYFSYSGALSDPDAEGGVLSFRTGTAIVTVSYDGRTWKSDGRIPQVPEAEARKAVLAAGGDVARALGSAAAPKFGDPVRPGAAPVRSVPRPCDMEPAGLTDRLAPGAQRERASSTSDIAALSGAGVAQGTYGAAADTCAWNSEPTCCLHKKTDDRPSRHLTVTARSVSDWRPGIGTWLTRRTFLSAYYDARESSGRSAFQRVRGLGDEAYAVSFDYGSDDDAAGAEVTFRYRNVIVSVTYTDGEKGAPLTSGAAITAAYTAAVRARAALPA